MQYDPKLKMVMAEIKDILKKYDVGAVVCLHGENQLSEYLNHINPKYSAAFWDDKGGFRIKYKLSDYGGDRKAQEIQLANTVNMLVHFRDFGSRTHSMCASVINMLKEHLHIQEGNGGHTSQQQIDN